MHGEAVIGVQGVQEGAEQAHLWGPCVEDQRNGGVVSYLHHLRVGVRKLYPVIQLYSYRSDQR